MKKIMFYIATVVTACYLALASFLTFRTIFEEAISPSVRFGDLAIFLYGISLLVIAATLAAISFGGKLNHWVTGVIGIVAMMAGLILSTVFSTKQVGASSLFDLMLLPFNYAYIIFGPLGYVIAGIVAFIFVWRESKKKNQQPPV